MAAPIALQLYTVRDALAHNFKSVVTRIAEIGYVGVETAGFPGIAIDEASDLFADLGLDVCSMHTQLPLGKQKNQVIELAHELEATRIVSSTPRDAFTSADALKALCDRWNQAAEIAAENGLELGLHNHWWEFQDVEGRPGFEQLVDALDESIFFQVDTIGSTPAAVTRCRSSRSWASARRFCTSRTARAIPRRTCSPSARGPWISRRLSRPATGPATG